MTEIKPGTKLCVAFEVLTKTKNLFSMALYQKTQAAPNSKLWVPDACVRGSLDKAVLNDQHLTQWACSTDPADLDAAQVCLREMANAAPPA